MALRIARTLTCTCGAEFSTTAANKVLCTNCQSARKKLLDSTRYQQHKAELLQQRRERRVKEKARREQAGETRKPYPGREVPCLGGCGAMVFTRNRNGQVCCPACQQELRKKRNARYRASDKGKAAAQVANLRNRQNEELQARKRERDRLRYREKREEILARAAAARRAKGIPPREIRPKPDVAAAAKTPAKVVAPVQKRLPTEEEKLAMLRAAMKRYYGE
ncbi:hypothetical protein [Mailhella sp.]